MAPPGPSVIRSRKFCGLPTRREAPRSRCDTSDGIVNLVRPLAGGGEYASHVPLLLVSKLSLARSIRVIFHLFRSTFNRLGEQLTTFSDDNGHLPTYRASLIQSTWPTAIWPRLPERWARSADPTVGAGLHRGTRSSAGVVSTSETSMSRVMTGRALRNRWSS